jgi:hypothetical protein
MRSQSISSLEGTHFVVIHRALGNPPGGRATPDLIGNVPPPRLGWPTSKTPQPLSWCLETPSMQRTATTAARRKQAAGCGCNENRRQFERARIEHVRTAARLVRGHERTLVVSSAHGKWPYAFALPSRRIRRDESNQKSARTSQGGPVETQSATEPEGEMRRP